MNKTGSYKVIVITKSTFGGRRYKEYTFNNEAHAEAWWRKWHKIIDIDTMLPVEANTQAKGV